MQHTDLRYLIPVDPDSDIPQYLQVANGLIRAIEKHRLSKGDQLPSIRQLCEQLEISFDTAKKAYAVLKKRNIVIASHGKSNVINASGPIPVFRVFLLIDELSLQKKMIYDAIMHSMPAEGTIDLYVYNNNPATFHHFIQNRKHSYTHNIIVPPAGNDTETAEIINKYFTGQELIILDGKIDGINTRHTSIYEDLDCDIYETLKSALHLIGRYNVVNIVLPEYGAYPPSLLRGFKRFCRDFQFIMNKWHGVNNNIRINKGELFVVMTDEDLVQLIDQLKARKLVTGKDVGIISSNDNPLKEVLLQGITTVSTDYKKMGEFAVNRMIKGGSGDIIVPFRITLRSSI
ncbi:MAG: GntR family transcriptional regulator [Chitinophagaceae bacterium]|nr:GntR family transcriptional regulator [Chitinophagaceae bacterium]